MSEQAVPERDADTLSGQPGTDDDTEAHRLVFDEQPGYRASREQPSAMVSQQDEDDTEGHRAVFNHNEEEDDTEGHRAM